MWKIVKHHYSFWSWPEQDILYGFSPYSASILCKPVIAAPAGIAEGTGGKLTQRTHNTHEKAVPGLRESAGSSHKLHTS